MAAEVSCPRRGKRASGGEQGSSSSVSAGRPVCRRAHGDGRGDVDQAGMVAGREAPMEVRGAVPPVALKGAERVVRDSGRGDGAGASG